MMSTSDVGYVRKAQLCLASNGPQYSDSRKIERAPQTARTHGVDEPATLVANKRLGITWRRVLIYLGTVAKHVKRKFGPATHLSSLGSSDSVFNSLGCLCVLTPKVGPMSTAADAKICPETFATRGEPYPWVLKLRQIRRERAAL